MGKKSRKRKEDKGTRKERLTERTQQRAIDVQQDEYERGGFNDVEDPSRDAYFIGDRVWLRDVQRDTMDNPCYVRCTVKAVDEDTGMLSVLPVDVPLESKDQLTRIPSQNPNPSRPDIVRDSFPWTLRFQKGDNLMCRGESGWERTTVSTTFHVTAFAKLCYRCYRHNREDGDDYPCLAVTHDDEICCVKRQTSFRFQMGNEVLFSSKHAVGLKKKRYDPWLRGKITGFDLCHRDCYAIYECTFEEAKGRTQKCYIPKDDDQHVTSLTATPRERLMQAIEDNCDYEHICYLVQSYNLDVLPFKSLVLDKAIEYACYGALLWLQEHAEIQLVAISDEEGNTFLHQICSSRFSHRFFSELATISKAHNKPDPYIHVFSYYAQKHGKGYYSTNKNAAGYSWLENVVLKGNLRTLELITSPAGIAWDLCHPILLPDEYLISAMATCNGCQKSHVMQNMIAELILFRSLADILNSLTYCCTNTEIPTKRQLAKFGSESETSVARRVGRFYAEWGTSHHSLIYSFEDCFQYLVPQGREKAVRWLTSANSLGLQTMNARTAPTNEDRREFLYLESIAMWQKQKTEDEHCEHLSMVQLASCGNAARCFSLSAIDARSYHAMLLMYCDGFHRGLSLNSFLENQSTSKVGSRKQLLNYRVALITDDKTLVGRLQILEFFVMEMHLVPPCAIDVIRWRQCGVLRWMAKSTNQLVNLKAKAREDSSILTYENRLQFLCGHRIPDNVSVAVILAMAAIEFDDLQSLQWLIDEQNLPLETIHVNGWNVAHICAYFGRFEIAIYLRSLSSWDDTIARRCTEKAYNSCFAVHLAVTNGHTAVADFLLSSGCTPIDSVGRSLEYYIKRSKYEHVKYWGEERAEPIRLAEDVFKLSKMLCAEEYTTEKVISHLGTTNCMSFERWQEYDIHSMHEKPSFLKFSYAEVFDLCCKTDDTILIKWLCERLFQSADLNEMLSFRMFQGLHNLRCSSMGYTQLSQVASNEQDGLLQRALSPKWARDIKANNPLEFNPLLARAQASSTNAIVLRDLKKIQHRQIRAEVLLKVRDAAMREIGAVLLRGLTPEDFSDTIQLTLDAVAEVALQTGKERSYYFADCDVFSSNGQINLRSSAYTDDSREAMSTSMMRWEASPKAQMRHLYIHIAYEGHAELLLWCLSRGSTLYSAEECDIIRIAAFFGHTGIVDIFLSGSQFDFSSAIEDRFQAAILGAAEAGRADDLARYQQSSTSLVVSKDPIEKEIQAIDIAFLKHRELMVQSLLVVSVFGWLNASSTQQSLNESNSRVLMMLLSKYDASAFLLAVNASISVNYKQSVIAKCPALLEFLWKELKFNASSYQHIFSGINKTLLAYTACVPEYERELAQDSLARWFETLISLGVDIQSVSSKRIDHSEYLNVLSTAKSKQLLLRSQFDPIKQGAQLQCVKDAVVSSQMKLSLRDEGGLMATHLAAAYDRVDILSYLVVENSMSMDEIDSNGRTVLDVAKASNAMSAANWIIHRSAMTTISSFLSTHFRRALALRKRQRLMRSLVKLQAWQRGCTIRSAYRTQVLSRLEESKRFLAIWGHSLRFCDGSTEDMLLNETHSWASIKRAQLDIVRASDIDASEDGLQTEALEQFELTANQAFHAADETDTEEVEQKAVTKATDSDAEYVEGTSTGTEIRPNKAISSSRYERIEYTNDVAKWMKKADGKYRSFFVRRLEQLAAGERSRTLAKKLAGCNTLIYETYLEQKSGHRILWTENGEHLLVWYVARHKQVPRLAKLIDDAENRSNRQLSLMSNLLELESNATVHLDSHVSDEPIHLNPLGNTVLKLYEVDFHELHKLHDIQWKPRLYLPREQREIVETAGTVMILGRSGTGKTICICNRMDYDLRRAGPDVTISQLFVSRSQRLCSFVRANVHETPHTKFTPFNRLLVALERSLSDDGDGAIASFLPSRRMDFARFKREVYQAINGIDALVVWSHIRSFLKGSMEALKEPEGMLSMDRYLAFGKRRCRLSIDQRKSVYDIFLSYCRYMTEKKLWDDCDRISRVLQRLTRCQQVDPSLFEELRYDKLYIDEVQDYTQAEIVLFFKLSGPGDLFLAGDPCQSVVEGVEFRFDDIRSVGYHLFGERQDLIPDKPKTLSVNFRSHAGILRTAAAVLGRLFASFPDSAKQLKEDRGLFRGPRPGIFQKVEPERLAALLTNHATGAVIITHDANVSNWRRTLGGYELIYGIREAKGLEFKTVLLLDFFSGIPIALQKPWRELLLGRATADFKNQYPEVEGSLKLLYTAITRSIQQLFFVETGPSISGDAFARWATSRVPGNAEADALVVRSNLDDLQLSQTPDDWCAAGFDNAIMAEESNDLDEAISWIEKSIYCFQQAGAFSEPLASKARTYRSSLRLRCRIVSSDPNTDFEMEAAQQVGNLLYENLFLEALEVCELMLPKLSLYSQEQLHEKLLRQLHARVSIGRVQNK